MRHFQVKAGDIFSDVKAADLAAAASVEATNSGSSCILSKELGILYSI